MHTDIKNVLTHFSCLYYISLTKSTSRETAAIFLLISHRIHASFHFSAIESGMGGTDEPKLDYLPNLCGTHHSRQFSALVYFLKSVQHASDSQNNTTVK